MEQIDVAVIGAGVTGLASALAVAERGRSVCVVERHPRAGLDTHPCRHLLPDRHVKGEAMRRRTSSAVRLLHEAQRAARALREAHRRERRRRGRRARSVAAAWDGQRRRGARTRRCRVCRAARACSPQRCRALLAGNGRRQRRGVGEGAAARG
ncbi:MAG: hypothetical protein DMF91_20720 [Acidobacteria bacterium]|nr:MAG: hypothetical protein DMF91_20720 [Acidobacteriota bacterium]